MDEFRYGGHLKAAFQGGGGLSGLESAADGKLPSGSARTFIDNWDTERNCSTLTYKDGAAHTLANVFMLASPYGSPNVFSGYTWTDKDAGPPNGGAADCSSDAWTCVHAQQAIAGMVGFHNATAGAELTDWWDDGSSALAFARAGKGFVAINNGDAELTRTFTTSLPAGTYCNVTTAAPDACDGNETTVAADGTATVTVPARGAVGLHV